jgi:putative membrane protein
MRNYVRVAIIGLLMGAAEIVPGVSGGTIAFISGIYERLVNCLRRFTPLLLIELKDHGIRVVWLSLDATFLVTLFAAMGIAILLFANAIGYLLEHQAVGLWSFFCGLVIASSWVLSKQINRTALDTWLALTAGVAVGFFITHLAPVDIEPSLVTLFLGGTIAVCAWILPGISGSFILLILGLYTYVLDAIRSFDIVSILALGLGCAVGIVSFAQILSRLLARFHNLTLAVLTGFMLGSLGKLWPWKHTTSYQLKSDGSQIPLVQESLLPETFELVTGQSADIPLAVGCAIAGCILVVLLDWAAFRPDQRPG